MSGGGSGSTNTVTSTSQPPAAYLNAYSNVNNQAQNVASTPYQQYQGNLVAPLSPDQQAGIQATENAQGAANPFINSAASEIGQSTTPIWSNAQQFSPDAVSQYELPYTQQVVNATQNEFQNQNSQQQQGIVGNAISAGAWGGDRSAVAQGIVAGQEQLAQAPVIAGLQNQGYSQALNEFNTQQQAQIGANEANNWLASQAGYGMANLGQEAQNTQLSGANALTSVGGLEQQQAQQSLNVPYEQYTAAQAYPFQTTGWLANIAEGLGGASGGSSSTTSPGASTASQIAGTGLAGVGALGQTGAFGTSSNNYNGWLSNLFGSGSSFNGASGSPYSYGAAGYTGAGPFIARGGKVPERATGGGIGNVLPFPRMMRAPPHLNGSGIANDNGFHNHPMKLAAGGIALPYTSDTYLTAPNGVQIPQIATGTGAGITGGTPVSDYLSAVAATASHAMPQMYQPPAPAASPSNGGGLSAPFVGTSTSAGGGEGAGGPGGSGSDAPGASNAPGGIASGGTGGQGGGLSAFGTGAAGSPNGPPGSVNANGAQIGGVLGGLIGSATPLGVLGSIGGTLAGQQIGNYFDPASRSMGIDGSVQSTNPGIDPTNPTGTTGDILSAPSPDFQAAGTPSANTDMGPSSPSSADYGPQQSASDFGPGSGPSGEPGDNSNSDSDDGGNARGGIVRRDVGGGIASDAPDVPDRISGTGGQGNILDTSLAAPASTGLAAPPNAPPAPSLPRGLRNNNPLNLEYAGQPGATSDGRFAVFPDQQSGVEAAKRQLQLYGARGINTLPAIISRWAPQGDGNNDPVKYAKTVAGWTGLPLDKPLDLNDPATLDKLVSGMGRFENGQPIGTEISGVGPMQSGAGIAPPQHHSDEGGIAMPQYQPPAPKNDPWTPRFTLVSASWAATLRTR